ncbi:MAG: hypothetical protein V4751_03040 [Pseudomonadota bacterium]
MTAIYANQGAGEWWASGRDTRSNRFTPLTQLNRDNFQQLTLVAEWNLPCNDIPIADLPNKQFGPNEGTPIKVGSFLYTVTAASQVAKFDLRTLAPALNPDGQPIVYDPQLYRHFSVAQIGFLHRGLIYWQDQHGNNARVFLAQGNAKLVALDPDTLTPIKTFGVAGVVSFHTHSTPVGKPLRYGATSSPMVCNGVVIVGCAIPDVINETHPPKGNVQAFDAITGAPLWSFNTIPTHEEMLALGLNPEKEWAHHSNDSAGQANVWTLMSADEQLGLVYLPTGSANNDSFGGHRPGNNLFSQTLVAVEAATGKVRWFQQLIRHGIWDYDIPAAPNLVDLHIDGKTEKLVVQVTKQAFAYVFNRETGQPRWDLIDVPVPASSVPGERASLTQPIPLKPLPFDHQGVYPEPGFDLLGRPVAANVLDFTPALKAQSMRVLEQYCCGPLYTPPVVKTKDCLGTLQLPGYIGGASWAGAVVNEQTGQLFVSSVTDPFINAVEPTAADSRYDMFVVKPLFWRPKDPASTTFSKYPLPLFAPPWGRITAIDLLHGEHSWPQPRPVGRGPAAALAAEIGAEHVPDGDLGWNRRTHLLATPTLLIGGQEADREATGFLDLLTQHTVLYKLIPEEPQYRTLNAYDQLSGELVSSIPVPAHPQGALMSFEFEGRQFVAYPAGGFNLAAKVLVFGV